MTHRPARINPDTRAALATAMLATGALVAVSFVLSFAGLAALAPWAGIPHRLAPLVPLFIDGAIAVYTYSALAARARGESARRPWTWVAMWAAVSSAANAAHAWSVTETLPTWQRVVGAVIAALFPIGALLGSHEIADRMIGRPVVADEATEALAVWASDPTLWRANPAALDELRARREASYAPGDVRPAHVNAPTTATPTWSDVPLFEHDHTDPKAQARALRAQGMSVRAIAQHVGLSKSTVATAVQDVQVVSA